MDESTTAIHDKMQKIFAQRLEESKINDLPMNSERTIAFEKFLAEFKAEFADDLEKLCDKNCANDNTLSLDQLDEVAGGSTLSDFIDTNSVFNDLMNMN